MNQQVSGRNTEKGVNKKSGSHGDHWSCITQSENEIIPLAEWALKEAKNPETGEWEGREVMAFIPESRSLTVCAITVDQSVCTGYPMAMDGVVHEVAVEHIEEWANGVEGQVAGSIGDAALAFFDTGYYRHSGRYREGERHRFALAAFAYTMSKAESRTIRGPDGIEHSTRNMAGYRPFPRGDIDDFVFQSPVKSVDTVRFNGKTVYRLTIPLFRLPGENGDYRDIDITLYAAEHVTRGYTPSVGDDVTGVIWMQGIISPE